jgi:hypothetical protein
VTTRRRSSRASSAEILAAVGEPPRPAAEATRLRQEVATVVAATVVATAVSVVPPVPVPTTVDQAAVVEIPDDDAPPPGWGQWESWPAPAPEPATGVLVMREDDCVMPRRPTHGTEALSSRAGLPTSNTTMVCLEREPAIASSTYFNEAQAGRRCGRSFETTGPRSTTR